jgi:hypothetical protein
MAKKYDLAVKVGTYEKNGETKNRYQNVGAVIEGERGPYILLDRHFNPAGIANPDNRSNVIISMFEPRDNSGGGRGGDGGFKDDVPF